MRALTVWQLIRLALERGSFVALGRALGILLGVRQTTPRPGELLPQTTAVVPELDTGGTFRAAWRPQDPAKDPREPYGSEGSSAGNDHGWSNCTMSSAALALAYQQPQGSKAPWGGDMRHSQSDLSGGTDLNDAKQAWADYGETLTIKSGAGWSAVVTAHNEGRAVVIQGEGNVPGSQTFDGGHACCIAPESQSDGDWLFGDPLATGWQWVSQSSIKAWAQAWSSSIAFAVGEKPPPPEPAPGPDPTPVPPPPVVDTTPYDQQDVDRAVSRALVAQGDAAVGIWVDWLRAPAPGAADHWDAGGWAAADDVVLRAFVDDPCPDPPDPSAPARWARGPVPEPASDAYEALFAAAIWSGASWRAVVWP